MRLTFVFVFASCLLFSCNNADKTPDLSNIKVELNTMRFEQALFTLDSSNYTANLDLLISKYPTFGENFLATILNTDPKWPADSAAGYVHGFTTAYRHVYDTAEIIFKDFSQYEKEIKQGVQLVKYYFPAYKDRKRIITYIGPLDGYGDILTDDDILVGLQHHLGQHFSLYRSTFVQETYPDYISNRFEPDYIAVNCMKNIVNDLYPEKMEDKPLVQQMVEKGTFIHTQ
jgi:hypothetical protein